MRPSVRHGFTLIELSIVLVIIGLLVGGILVGRDLIHAAELRATVKQFETYNTAIGAFRLKYSCLPGDCANATSFGLRTSPGIGDNGDGNAQIGVNSGGMWLPESANLWIHLTNAQMVSETLIDMTQITYGAKAKIPSRNRFYPQLGWAVFFNNQFFSFQHLKGYHVFWLTPQSNDDGGAGLMPADALSLDSKLDDGRPISGTVIATSDNESNYGPVAIDPLDLPEGCVVSSPPYDTYDATSTSTDPAKLCGLVLKASF